MIDDNVRNLKESSRDWLYTYENPIRYDTDVFSYLVSVVPARKRHIIVGRVCLVPDDVLCDLLAKQSKPTREHPVLCISRLPPIDCPSCLAQAGSNVVCPATGMKLNSAFPPTFLSRSVSSHPASPARYVQPWLQACFVNLKQCSLVYPDRQRYYLPHPGARASLQASFRSVTDLC